MDCLLTTALPTSFFLYRSFLLPLLYETHKQLQILNCDSLLIPDKPILVGEIPGNLFILGQHFDAPYRYKRRPPTPPTPPPKKKGLTAGEQTGLVPKIEHIELIAFLADSWSLNVFLSPGSKLTLSLLLKLPSPVRDPF